MRCGPAIYNRVWLQAYVCCPQRITLCPGLILCPVDTERFFHNVYTTRNVLEYTVSLADYSVFQRLSGRGSTSDACIGIYLTLGPTEHREGLSWTQTLATVWACCQATATVDQEEKTNGQIVKAPKKNENKNNSRKRFPLAHVLLPFN